MGRKTHRDPVDFGGAANLLAKAPSPGLFANLGPGRGVTSHKSEVVL